MDQDTSGEKKPSLHSRNATELSMVDTSHIPPFLYTYKPRHNHTSCMQYVLTAKAIMLYKMLNKTWVYTWFNM